MPKNRNSKKKVPKSFKKFQKVTKSFKNSNLTSSAGPRARDKDERRSAARVLEQRRVTGLIHRRHARTVVLAREPGDVHLHRDLRAPTRQVSHRYIYVPS